MLNLVVKTSAMDIRAKTVTLCMFWKMRATKIHAKKVKASIFRAQPGVKPST